jgi:AcrR family transcriptional regulator
MKSHETIEKRRPGRPSLFDRDAAVHAAMLLFWRHGYEATSVADLIAAMGITPPSLYAAFGDKKGLFRAALARYLDAPVGLVEMMDAAPSARAAAARLLEGAALRFTGADTPAGCLVAGALSSCPPGLDDVRRELSAVRDATRAALRARIARDVAEGRMAGDADADVLAAHVVALVQGMATLARDGMPRALLLRIAEQGLTGWPDGATPG